MLYAEMASIKMTSLEILQAIALEINNKLGRGDPNVRIASGIVDDELECVEVVTIQEAIKRFYDPPSVKNYKYKRDWFRIALDALSF